VNALTVRTATQGEGDALTRLQWRASAADPAFEEVIREAPQAIGVPQEWLVDGNVFVAERSGTIVGFAAVLAYEDRIELEALFVEPEAWRTGVGRALVEHAAAVAREIGAGTLDVMGNPNVAGLYEACGFEAIGTRQLTFGWGVIMQLRL
jgi:N-acetylglutamate synthase-like GNAT family acetyltransferase